MHRLSFELRASCIYWFLAAFLSSTLAYAMKNQAVCEDIFRSQAVVSVPSERLKLLNLADRFFAEPAVARHGLRKTDRRQFRDRIFSETIDQIFADVEVAIARLEVQTVSKSYGYSLEENLANKEQRLEFARIYLAKLRRKTALERRGSQESSNAWAVTVGFHASAIHDYLAGDSVGLGSLRTDLAASKSMDAYVEKRMKLITWYTQHATNPYFLAIPTAKWFSTEGAVELLANGVRVYGTYSNAALKEARQNSHLYYSHDMGHAAQWANAIASVLEPEYLASGLHKFYLDRVSLYGHGYRRPIRLIKDPMTSVTYQRIQRRLQTIVDRVKRLPKNERDAGFAVLFFMFHEKPETYYRILASADPLAGWELTVSDPADLKTLLRELEDPHDLGRDFHSSIPSSWVIQAGNEVVSQASAGL